MMAHRAAAHVQEALRLKLYDKIADIGPAFFAGERTGEVMLSLVDRVEQLQTFFGQYGSPLLHSRRCHIRHHRLAGRAGGDADAEQRAGVPGAARRVQPPQCQSQRGASRASLKRFGAEFLDAVQGLATLKAFGQSTAYGRLLADKARTLSAATRGLTPVSANAACGSRAGQRQRVAIARAPSSRMLRSSSSTRPPRTLTRSAKPRCARRSPC